MHDRDHSILSYPPPSRISVAVPLLLEKLRSIVTVMFRKVSDLNIWLAQKFNTKRETILRIELGGLLASGFTLMQVGEYMGAIACWVALGFLLFAKAIAWNAPNKIAKFCIATLVFAVPVLLITITSLRKPDDEPWSNLQKLWQQKLKVSIEMSSLVTNGAVSNLWLSDDSSFVCPLTTLAQVYLTNDESRWVTITRIYVEGLDNNGDWKKLKIIRTQDSSSIYIAPDFSFAQPHEPIDRKFFDQEVIGKSLGPGQTTGGMLFLVQKSGDDIRGPLRFVIFDLKGKSDYTAPIDIGKTELIEGGFRTLTGFKDLTGLKKQQCPAWGWR